MNTDLLSKSENSRSNKICSISKVRFPVLSTVTKENSLFSENGKYRLGVKEVINFNEIIPYSVKNELNNAPTLMDKTIIVLPIRDCYDK